MKFSGGTFAGFAAGGLILIGCSAAAGPKSFLAETARSVDGGRSVVVVVPQEEIKSSINEQQTNMYGQGGAVGALVSGMIDAKINSDREKRAEAGMGSVRDAMTDFNADVLATGATVGVTAALPWFGAVGAPVLIHDPSNGARNDALAAASGSQTAFFTYQYDLAPDFRFARVSLTVDLQDKIAPMGVRHGGPSFSQAVECDVDLPDGFGTLDENAERWSADHGALLRRALRQGFDCVRDQAPGLLTRGEAEVKDITHQHTTAKLGAVTVLQVSDGPEGQTLYDPLRKILIVVRTLEPPTVS